MLVVDDGEGYEYDDVEKHAVGDGGMDCAMISPWDSSASVSDGDSAYADRICLPVVCAIHNLYRCL